MNQAHLHLLLNHLSVLGSLFGLLLLLSGIVFRNLPIRRAGLVTLVIAALTAIPAVLTGEGAEEVVETLPGISDTHLEAHEDFAETAFWSLIAAGAFALVAFGWSFLEKRNQTAPPFIVFLVAAIAFGLMARTAWLGGKLRHSELRTETAAPPVEDDD